MLLSDLPFVIRERGSSFRYKSGHVLRGRVSIGPFCLGGCFYIFEGCSEDLCIFSFLSLLDTLSFVHRSCDHLVTANIVFILDIYIFDDFVITFYLSLYVLFLFSLYTHVSYLLYAIFYFYFTLRCLDEFCLKCFRNTGCQNLSCLELSSCKVFQEFMLGLDFIVFNR